MKKTMIGAAGAGVLALALAGGGTFAAWSDFYEENASVGAGILQLTVSSTGGAGTTESFGFGNLAPGENKIQEIFIASSDVESVPDGTLTMDLKNIVNTEANGPGGGASVPTNCTTNSEADAEGNNNDLPDDTVDCAADGGEFGEEAYIQIVHKAAASPSSCAGGSYGLGAVGVLNTVVAGAPITLDTTVAPGEGRCIRIELGLPDGNITPPGIDFAGSADSTDASQGDSATFDVRFDLVQNVT